MLRRLFDKSKNMHGSSLRVVSGTRQAHVDDDSCRHEPQQSTKNSVVLEQAKFIEDATDVVVDENWDCDVSSSSPISLLRYL